MQVNDSASFQKANQSAKSTASGALHWKHVTISINSQFQNNPRVPDHPVSLQLHTPNHDTHEPVGILCPPPPTLGKTITVLSIDGGGVRGIIPGIMLGYLKSKLQVHGHLATITLKSLYIDNN
ncbi:hypothetical protein Sjap_017809 [Stephania japonica]|uniref:PNPLA domain-containing protein n=1 Tax=Stephania japonica TaxID=461633 RepID=A0AAP0NKE5_9MAGN